MNADKRATRGDILIETYRELASHWHDIGIDIIPTIVADLLYFAAKQAGTVSAFERVDAGIANYLVETTHKKVSKFTVIIDDENHYHSERVYAEDATAAVHAATINYANQAPDLRRPEELLIASVVTGHSFELRDIVGPPPPTKKYQVHVTDTRNQDTDPEFLIVHASKESDARTRAEATLGDTYNIKSCELAEV